jgi:hypothetical protein
VANGGAGGNPGAAGGDGDNDAGSGGAGGGSGVGGAGGDWGGYIASPGTNYAALATSTGIASLASAGGNGGTSTGSGDDNTGGGGGGGGYGGGGGAVVFGGGGGGGSYGQIIIGGTNALAGNNSDPNYVASAGNGGSPSFPPSSGQDGLVVIIFGNTALANIPATVVANGFDGNGGGLTNLNVSQLTGGSLPTSVLPSGLAALATNNGIGLTNLNATNLIGTLSTKQLPANVVTNTETGVTLSGTFSGTFSAGTVTATSFTGNGGGLTNLTGTNLVGTILQTNLGATNSFSPTIGNGSANFTPSTSAGYYAKSGNLVYFEIFISWSSLNGINSGSVVVSLPFAVQSQRAVFDIGYVNGINVSGQQIIAIASAGATNIDLWSNPNNGGNPVTVPVSACSIPGQIQITGTYRWQ